MTPQSLSATGSALYGPRWKTPLARRLGVSRETVSRWASGAQKISPSHARFIALLVRSRGTVLSLCERTGNMVRPWADAGFECICVDIQHEGDVTEGNIRFIGADVLEWMPPPRRYAIAFAAPPCTDLAVSGARWFQEKGLEAAQQAFAMVNACRRILEWSEAPWMLENPVSTLSTYWRRPDYLFDPCDYGGYLDSGGEGYTKKTCLWTGGGFVMPGKKPVASHEGSKMHRMAPAPDRADQRSVTPERVCPGRDAGQCEGVKRVAVFCLRTAAWVSVGFLSVILFPPLPASAGHDPGTAFKVKSDKGCTLRLLCNVKTDRKQWKFATAFCIL